MVSLHDPAWVIPGDSAKAIPSAMVESGMSAGAQLATSPLNFVMRPPRMVRCSQLLRSYFLLFPFALTIDLPE